MIRFKDDPRNYIHTRVRIDEDTGCWVWKKSLNIHGYGQCNILGRIRHAHIVSFEVFVGQDRLGLDLDHLCRNRACVNPEHLELVTRQVNLLRGVGFIAQNAALTSCKRGHLFDSENTYRDSKGRRCRVCAREARRTLSAEFSSRGLKSDGTPFIGNPRKDRLVTNPVWATGVRQMMEAET